MIAIEHVMSYRLDPSLPMRAPSHPTPPKDKMTATPDLAIRLRRADFNRALADADLDGIGPLLTKDVVLVTGTESAVLSGRKAQLLAWKREFAAPSRTIYTRTPATITVSSLEPIALEHGRWRGIDTSAGQPAASGSYTAKWREIGSDWMIEAEIYITLA